MSSPSTGKNRCSYCGGDDHNRRNKKHHPNLNVLVRDKKRDSAAYSRIWRRERVATHSLRGICVWCGDTLDRASVNLQRRMCAGCRVYRNGQQKGLREERRRYRAALVAIADGWCLNPRDVAREALGSGAQVRRAA